MNENSSLIYIPDISGFTNFITKTEIKHSRHIISELLEKIVNANELNLTVSEIEGDAVLFYKLGAAPSLNELYKQSKKMFVDFHSHLKVIERDRVCQCGACSTASELTLKFITHFGELQETKISNFTKLIGRDVILAHRLLKNNIVGNEYLLLTNNYLADQDEANNFNAEWGEICDHSENIENFGDVRMKYITLKHLKELVPKFPIKSTTQFEISESTISITINAPILLAHELLIDNELKKEWVPGLINLEGDPLNRINSFHICEFDEIEIKFKTKGNEVNNNEIFYSETADPQLGFMITNNYKLIRENGSTQLLLSSVPYFEKSDDVGVVKTLLNKIKLKFILKKVTGNSRKNLQLFKEYCEKVSKERALN